MTTSAVASQVRAHYPQAMPAAVFRRQIFGWLEDELGMALSNVLLATSICADDIVFITDDAGNVETRHATKELLGPFDMGGLAGLPFAGKTGMTAFAHHVPDHGAACIVYGPHIGMTDAGVLGKVLRLGQHDESPACGALGVALKHFQSEPNYEPFLDMDDAQEALLEQRLKPHMAQILAAPNPMQAASEAAYRVIEDLILRYVAVAKAQFRCERLALVGVLIVNTSPEHEDYFDLRHQAVLRLADL
ncbi:MAG TPA: hypothetical protein VL334_18970 [Anaerolineae bacterium]|nr:hypothetical protein [Anaerolineae bacterium]